MAENQPKDGSKKRYGALVVQEGPKRIRAMGMLELRVRGYTLQEIADEYRCSIDTVQRQLDWAAREGQILKHEEDILSRLVPKAIQTYEAALDKGDVFVAKDLFAMLSRLSERIDKRQEHVEELSLAAYLKTRKRTENPDRARSVGSALPVIEVRQEDVRPGEGDAPGEDETGRSLEYANGPAGIRDGEVSGDAEAGPPSIGPGVDAGSVPAVGAQPASADGESGLPVIDAEVVLAEAPERPGDAV